MIYLYADQFLFNNLSNHIIRFELAFFMKLFCGKWKPHIDCKCLYPGMKQA